MKRKREGYFPLLGTAEIASNLGVTRATVVNYVRARRLKALVDEPRMILVTDDEFRRFKREDFPLIRRGRPPKRKARRG